MNERIFLPAAIIAGFLCFFFSKIVFLGVFFLIPLSFICFRSNSKTAWAAFFIASGLNLITAVISMAIQETSGIIILLDTIFVIILCGIFTWINAPRFFGVLIRGAWRMIIGSLAALLGFMVIFYQGIGVLIYELVNSQMEIIGTLYQTGTVMDSQSMDNLVESVRTIMLRGGVLVSVIAFFWISRQAGILLTRFTKVPFKANRLANFFLDFRIIWALSISIILVLLLRFTGNELLDIAVWNILVLCVILYLVQGFGILQYLASKFAVPFFVRAALCFLFIILLFRPGINLALLGALFILGVIENWLPIRASKIKGPPSTPEAGNDGDITN